MKKYRLDNLQALKLKDAVEELRRKRKQHSYVRNLLFALFAVYFAQGSLYATGSLISQSALALIFSISTYYFFLSWVMLKQKDLFFIAWSLLLVINISGYFFTADYSLHFGMFKGVLMSLLTFYPFYYFAQIGVLKSRHLLYFFLLMLPISILQFFLNETRILTESSIETENVVNNIAYTFVGLMPFVFLMKKQKLLSVAGMLLLMFFIISGAKRGAIVTGAVGLLFFAYYHLRTVDKKHRFRTYLLTLAGIAVLGYFAVRLYESNEYLVQRMQLLEEGNSSGRDIIYANIFNGWYHSESFFNQVFGFGFAGSMKLSGTGNFAHNDWLELLSNFGLVGATLYLLLFYASFRYILFSAWGIDKKILMAAIVLIWLATTLFSMAYTSDNGYVRAMLLAYLIGNKSNNLT